jgi:hypothetical protein
MILIVSGVVNSMNRRLSKNSSLVLLHYRTQGVHLNHSLKRINYGNKTCLWSSYFCRE